MEAITEPARVALGNRGKALVVDDDITNRLVLKSMLAKSGFEVIQAEDGEQALLKYTAGRPDIVFMDVMMPVMDGFEAARRIKSLAGNEFIPIIFLTALTDEKSLARCIEVGGDDFLSKPFSYTLLEAKIQSMERIRDLNREVAGLYRQIQHEEEIAERIFNGAVTNDNVMLEQIKTLLRPAAIFSGDMLLTTYSPTRDLHVLLADFTGHGLAAALGALPASEVFRTMAGKGFLVEEILRGINRKLHHLLPTGLFMAAQYVCINSDLEYITVCNCGMPDILLLDADGRHISTRIVSRGLPLGIDPDVDYGEIREYRTINRGDRVVLASDGVIEATNINGEMFGEKRFEQALCEKEHETLKSVGEALDVFCKGATPSDDISLVEVQCVPEILPVWDMQVLLHEKAEAKDKPALDENEMADSLEFNLLVEGRFLRNADPVPLIINHLVDSTDCELPRQTLFVILSELFVNALDHGVLELDSALKHRDEGFEHYFKQRDQRLAALDSGQIRISVRLYEMREGGRIDIQVEDSGAGFDYLAWEAKVAEESVPSGRGIYLLHQLCESVTYYAPGNRVFAVYRWDNNG